MKRPWIILAISLCAAARPATAQHEPPSHDDRSSGDVGHGDAGNNDTGPDNSGGHDSPADSSPSSGGDSGHHDSGDAPGSSDTSPSWSGSDAGSWEPPPGARPRDPDSVESPPTDVQLRHPRPEAGPDEGRFPNPPETGGSLWDDEERLGPTRGDSPFDYDGDYTHSPDPYRKPSEYSVPIRLLVKPDQAAVYVDGQYAGIVKHLRGKEKLYLSPGFHVIVLVLEGYHTGRADFAVLVGASEIKVRGKLQRIGPE